jgi:hypothetical protein
MAGHERFPSGLVHLQDPPWLSPPTIRISAVSAADVRMPAAERGAGTHQAHKRVAQIGGSWLRSTAVQPWSYSSTRDRGRPRARGLPPSVRRAEHDPWHRQKRQQGGRSALNNSAAKQSSDAAESNFWDEFCGLLNKFVENQSELQIGTWLNPSKFDEFHKILKPRAGVTMPGFCILADRLF